MATNTQILGQVMPAAATLSAIYTVPVSTSATASTIVACNQAGTATTFRISVAIGGAADAAAQYIYYDVTIAGNDTFAATIGMTLATGDEVRVYSASGNVSFTLFGVEVTP
jgi:hypothetical protein